VPEAWNPKKFAWRFSETVFAGVGPLLIVLLQPPIQIGLQLLQGRVQLLTKRHTVKLILQGAMESFADPIRLRRFCAGPTVIDILHCQVELVFVVLTLAAVLRSAVRQNAQQGNLLLFKERVRYDR